MYSLHAYAFLINAEILADIMISFKATQREREGGMEERERERESARENIYLKK